MHLKFINPIYWKFVNTTANETPESTASRICWLSNRLSRGRRGWKSVTAESKAIGKPRNIFIQRVHYPTRCIAASAWVICKLSRRNSRSGIHGVSWGEKSGAEGGWTKTLSVTFNPSPSSPRHNGKSCKCSRRLVHGLWPSPLAGIYLLSQTAFHRSHIYYHISRKRLENSQIYERTSGQINTPPRGPVFGIHGIREWQNAKWTDVVPYPGPCRIATFGSKDRSCPAEEWHGAFQPSTMLIWLIRKDYPVFDNFSV